MSRLGDLSNELLMSIFDHLPQKDLCNVSRCSRLFHEICEPSLYSAFSFTQLEYETDPDRLSNFIQTLLAKPHLARHMKHYQAFDTLDDPVVDLSWLDETQKDWAKTSWLPDSAHEWYNDLFDVSGNLDAVTAMLLLLFSDRLKSIDLENYAYMGADWRIRNKQINSFMKEMARLQDQFITTNSMANLRDVSLSWNAAGGALPPACIFPFMKLKSVRLFQGNITGLSKHRIMDDEFNARAVEPVKTFGTKQLTLECSGMTSVELAKFFSRFPVLSSLSLSWYDIYTVGNDVKIGSALACSQGSLESLDVKCGEPGAEWKNENMIGSLASFRRLRILEVCAENLMGAFKVSDEPSEDVNNESGEESVPRVHRSYSAE